MSRMLSRSTTAQQQRSPPLREECHKPKCSKVDYDDLYGEKVAYKLTRQGSPGVLAHHTGVPLFLVDKGAKDDAVSTQLRPGFGTFKTGTQHVFQSATLMGLPNLALRIMVRVVCFYVREL
jgi:hypothetical protein